MTLLLKNGTVVDPSQNLDQVKLDVLIKDGKIADLAQIESQTNWEVVNLAGCFVAPGFVDMHVHLREPGQEEKETIKSGSKAAAAGGFTSILCMPNTEPVNDSPSITRFILEKARQINTVNVYPCGAISKGLKGETLAEIGEMVEAGVLAISDDGNPVENPQLMRRALEYSRLFDIPVIDHCENPSLAAGGCIHEGTMSTRLGLPGMSRTAEELDVVRDVILSRVTRGHAHIAHLSTMESLDWIRQAKNQEIPITCEVTPHHFILKDEDINFYDTNCKMNPPLREGRDVEAMLQGLQDGSIDCIATDHAPHTKLDKETTFVDAANGVIGLECAISLAWEFLVKRKIVTIYHLVELFSLNPSRILKLNKGTLKKGSSADVTIIDPNRVVTVNKDKFQSLSSNCPFDGWKLKGAPVMTIVGGRIVYSTI